MTDEQQNPEFVPDGEAGGDGPEAPLFQVPNDASSLTGAAAPAASGEVTELKQLVGERTADLQRLQAEYVNYKKRVDRDRDQARARGVEAVVIDLLPVLDSIEAARQHEDLGAGFRMVADELEKVGAKHGLVLYGEVGEPFDPNVHEALMRLPYEGEHEETVVAAVIQRGARINDRVLRPARVGVADPS